MATVTRTIRTIAIGTVALLLALLLSPQVAHADSTRIVTLGADLTDSQRETVLAFFGLTEDDLDELEVITVTNSDERELLSDYISTTIIGTKTISCSYIEPTTSGGINIETANLTYVTKNTIYNALQTAGIENCNVVVTAPYEVSGTGALTGIFLAYEATGEELDDEKEAAAAEELIESAELEAEYGEDVASVISSVKNDVTASDDELTSDEIAELVAAYAEEAGLTLDEDAIDTIVNIAERVQQLEYDSDAFSETLGDLSEKLDSLNDTATGIWETIKNFFASIAEWFSNLFASLTGGSSDNTETDNETSDVTDSDDSSSAGILGTLNTEIYELDGTESSTSSSADDSSSDDANGDNGSAVTDEDDGTTVSGNTVSDTSDASDSDDGNVVTSTNIE